MKKRLKNKGKGESGAILFLSVVVMTTLICFLALTIDFGFIYYQNAKLQNAVDAAVTAVAANPRATSDSSEEIAQRYLYLNGYDKEKYDDDDFKIDVTKKYVYLNNDDSMESSTCYVKLVVDVDTHGFFTSALGVNSSRIHRESFAKCAADCSTGMPEALKYTLFAASISGTESDPAIDISGKLQENGLTNAFDTITSGIEDIINGAYNIYYKVSNHFGWGNLGSNDFVHINTSETIVNNNVHSNSTIDISTQAINVTRLKDGLNEDNTIDDDNGIGGENYGQVIFDAVKSIKFSSTKPNRQTHVYVQNTDCVTQTQETLRLLKMNPSDLTAYEQLINDDLANGNIFENIARQISSAAGAGQSGNIAINSDSINLTNQRAIVYDVGQDVANQMLEEHNQDGWEKTIDNASIDDTYGEAYQGESAKNDTFSKSAETDAESGEPTKAISISGTQINRQLDNDYFSTSSNEYKVAYANAKVAMATAFQQNEGWEGYIPTPDMNLYYTRQLVKSLRQTSGDLTIKNKGDSDEILAKYLEAFENTYKKQIENNGKYYDTSVETADKLVNLLNVQHKTGYSDRPTDIENRSQILGYTVFNTNESDDITSARTAKNLVKDGYDSLQYNENGSGDANNAKKLTDEDAVKLFKKGITSNNESYDDKKAEIESKYNIAMITSRIKTSSANIPTKSVSTAVDSKSATVEDKVNIDKVIEEHPAIAKNVKTFDFSSINIDKSFLNTSDGSTGTSSSPDTPYNRLLTEWKKAHLDDMQSYYMPTVSNYKATFPSGAGTSDISFGSSSGSVSGTGTKEVNSGFYTSMSTSSRSIRVNENRQVVVSGNVSPKQNLDVYSNSVLVVNGDVYINDGSELQIRSGAKVFINGSLSGACNKLVIEDGAELYVKGNARIDSIDISGKNHKIIIGGNLDLSYDDTQITFNNDDTIYIGGELKTFVLYNYTNLVVGSFYNEGRMSDSLFNKNYNGVYNNPEASMYVNGDFTNLYTTNNNSERLYIKGNANLGGNNVDASNSIKVSISSNTYIGGTLNCNNHNVYMPNDGQSTGTFSVYGNGASGNSNVVVCDEFAFYAGGVNVYVYGDANSKAISASNAITSCGNMYLFGSASTNKFYNGCNQGNVSQAFIGSTMCIKGWISTSGDSYNKGTLYIDDSFSSSANFDNQGDLYIVNGFTMSNLTSNHYFEVGGNITATSSINSTAEIYCGGDYKSNGSLTQSANATVLGAITSSGSMNLGGTICCGNYVDFEGDSTFSGIIYINGVLKSNQSNLTLATGAAVYVPSTFTAKNFTNNGYFAAKDNISLSGNLYNSLEVFTNGNIDVSGTIQNTGSNAKILSGGYIKADGKFTVDSGLVVANNYIQGGKELVNNGNIYSISYVSFDNDITGSGSIYAQSFVKGKTINVTGGVFAGGSIDATTGILSITGGATATGHISATSSLSTGDVILGGNVNVSGYIYASDYITVNNGSTVVATGFIDSDGANLTKSVNINGTVYCGGYLTTKTKIIVNGKLYCSDYIEAKLLTTYSDITNNGEIICTNYMNCKDLVNAGSIVLGGTLTSGTCTNNGGSIYAVGNSKLGKIVNSGEIYVSGSVTSSLGMQNTGTFGCMGSFDVSAGLFTNSGDVYVYGSVTSGAVNASSTGHTFVGGNYDASINSINVSGGHEFVALKNIEAKFISSTGGSKIYAVEACNITTGGFTLESDDEEHISELFCGPKSTKMDGYELSINGKFYFPDVAGTWQFNRVDIGKFGNATFNCDVVINKYLLVQDGGTLYIAGDTVFKGCALTLEGKAKAYFMGKLTIDKSSRFSISKSNTNYYYNFKFSDESTFYCGGGSDYQLELSGFFQVRGTAVFDCSVITSGWYPSSGVNNQAIAGLFEQGSTTLISGNLYCNNNGVYVMENALLNVKGAIDYAGCMYNGNKLLAYGGITMNEHNNYANYDSGKLNSNASDKLRDYDYFALRNGYVNMDWQNNPNVVMYNGNDDGILNIGGGFQNYGKYYSEGGLHTNEGHNYIGINAQSGSASFFGGEIINGWSTAIRNNTVFMCDGDYTTSRATKINIDDNTDDVDQYTNNYTYIGGNFISNTLGQTVGGTNSNNSADLDLYSNTNMLVKGSAYINSKLYMKQNVSFVVCGEIDTPQHSDYSVYISKCLDQNICSTLAMNGGGMYVNSTAKIRDMTKTYIDGNLYVNDYLEIGKAINETNPSGDGLDETLASTTRYRENGESKKEYKFSNAAYLSAKGDIFASKYCKIYASTTVKAGGDFTVAAKYLTLRHDAKLYVGKKCKANQSIDGGSYSQFHIGGSMQAIWSTIKIRDNCIVDVGGNLYSNSYIELGKKGDYTREVENGVVSEWFNGTKTAQSVDEGSVTEEGTGDTDASGGNSGSSEEAEDTSGNATVGTDDELRLDATDDADGSTVYVGKSLYSYTGYIKIFHATDVTCGGFVYTSKYLTLRSSATLNVQPEMFGNTTYDPNAPLYEEDADLLEKLVAIVGNAFTPKYGTIYSFGELTLNKNASLTATYDTLINGQCVLREDSLIYTGHDFSLVAPSANVSLDLIKGEKKVTGFDSDGKTVLDEDGKLKSYPVMIFAGNDIGVTTTISMRMTYMIAGNDVNLTDIYSNGENVDNNAQELPNSIAALNGNILYNGVYSKFGGIFYAPLGNLTLKGFYLEMWGSAVADTIDISSYYFALHRFENWDSMKLLIPEASKVFIINEETYNEETANAIDDTDE